MLTIYMLAVIGTKVAQTQKFLVNGTRIPVTIVATPGNTVTMVKTQDKHGYWAVQLGLGERKIANKPQMGHAQKAQLKKAPLFMAEAQFTEKESTSLPQLGDLILAQTVVVAGDIVDVSGTSKGKGFAGGVKRHGFHGGPKTHGQSDRHRAPGSIGSGTTPGRVYRGKRMAGKMGNDNVTLKNLEIAQVGNDFVWVKGIVPGKIGSVVIIKPTGKKNKKFVEVLQPEGANETNETKVEEQIEEVPAEEVKVEQQTAEEPKEEVQVEATVVPKEPEEAKVEKKEEQAA